jgi:hypothetical protein
VPANPATIAATPLDVRVIAVSSLLLSLWLIAIDRLLDRVAILYLRCADAYLQDGFGGGKVAIVQMHSSSEEERHQAE